jgi:hypothetical protein
MIAFAIVLTVGAQASGGELSAIPVRIGGDANFDACSSVGVVSGLQTGQLRVRSGPGTQYRKVDAVGKGQLLWLCGQDGPWQAVVYTRNEAESCGVSSPVVPEVDYTGPCQSGWVHEDYVSLVAG